MDKGIKVLKYVRLHPTDARTLASTACILAHFVCAPVAVQYLR